MKKRYDGEKGDVIRRYFGEMMDNGYDEDMGKILCI